MLERLLKKYFDYDIIGEYYDMERDDKGVCYYRKKYNKKYYLKCLRKRTKI